MPELSTARLYALRAMYLFMFAGLAATIWPLILNPPPDLQHMRGVVWSLLTALSLLSALGIRYPIAMLPLLFFELAWKVIWVGLIGYPLWAAGALDAAHQETWYSCLMGVVLVPLVIPWGYVWTNYVKAPGNRWRRA